MKKTQIPPLGFKPTKKTTQHTMGPWDVRAEGGIYCPKKKKQICRLDYTDMKDDEFEANADLIAAAPSMYEFLAKKADSGDNEALTILRGIHGDAKRD